MVQKVMGAVIGKADVFTAVRSRYNCEIVVWCNEVLFFVCLYHRGGQMASVSTAGRRCSTQSW